MWGCRVGDWGDCGCEGVIDRRSGEVLGIERGGGVCLWDVKSWGVIV